MNRSLTLFANQLFFIVRANQKDSYYQQILKDQVKDAVRDIFGNDWNENKDIGVADDLLVLEKLTRLLYFSGRG